jgi:hypothetical protein
MDYHKIKPNKVLYLTNNKYLIKKNVIYQPPNASTPYLSPNITLSTF